MGRRFENFSKKKASKPVSSNKLIFGLAAALFAFSPQAMAQAILIEDGRSGVRGTIPEPTKDYEPTSNSSGNKGSLKEYFDRQDYVNLFQLRSQRRMGVGAEVLGRLGMIGTAFDLNFDPRHSATAGIGAGPQYYSYSLGYKRVLDDANVSPYMGIAFTRMVGNSGTAMTESTPAWLSDYFLSGGDRTSEGFVKNFISPQMGIQFTQFYGPSAGASFYLEILLMYESESNRTAPVAALGMMYYL